VGEPSPWQTMPRDVGHRTFADQVHEALHEAYGYQIPQHLEEIVCQLGVSSPRRHVVQASPRISQREGSSVSTPSGSDPDVQRKPSSHGRGSPRGRASGLGGKSVGHRLYDEGVALRERRKAFMEEVMNLEQADLRRKAKELLNQGSRLYPSTLRPSSPSGKDRKERRYPGRCCGSPKEAPLPSPSGRPRSPKSRQEVMDDASQTTQASSSSPVVESPELELLKKQLGILSMGASMLLKQLTEVPETPQRGDVGASSVEVDAPSPSPIGSPVDAEDPQPSPHSRRPSISRAGQASHPALPFVEQGAEPQPCLTTSHPGGSPSTNSPPSPVWGQVEMLGRPVTECGPPPCSAGQVRPPSRVTVKRLVQVRPSSPVTQRVSVQSRDL